MKEETIKEIIEGLRAIDMPDYLTTYIINADKKTLDKILNYFESEKYNNDTNKLQ